MADHQGEANPSPPVTVKLPRALLELFPDAPPELQLHAATVAEMLNALDERWPGMRDRLCDSTPRIRRHLNIFVDGKRATLRSKSIPSGNGSYFDGNVRRLISPFNQS